MITVAHFVHFLVVLGFNYLTRPSHLYPPSPRRYVRHAGLTPPCLDVSTLQPWTKVGFGLLASIEMGLQGGHPQRGSPTYTSRRQDDCVTLQVFFVCLFAVGTASKLSTSREVAGTSTGDP